MPSTPESNLRLELQATGENATTWGTKTNSNLELLSQAIAGAANVDVGGSGNYTLVASNYASDEARAATLVLTGTLTGNRDVIVPTTPKHYTVLNQTSGAFTLTIRQTASSGVAIPRGTSLVVCTSTTCVDPVGTERLVPAGTVASFAGATAPAGWLLCAGQAVSRTTYADLFTVLSTVHGSGDGSTTFNLPDLRGRAIFGRDDMGGTATNRITNVETGITGTTLGAVGGDQRVGNHTHNTQAHAHGATNGAHYHSYQTPSELVGRADGGSPTWTGTTTLTTGTIGDLGITIIAQTVIVDDGGGGTGANIPPAIILNYIIKT